MKAWVSGMIMKQFFLESYYSNLFMQDCRFILKPAFYKEMSITCRKKMEIQTPVLFNEMKHL